MPDLIIDYDLSHDQPGYRLRSSVDGYDKRTLKAIWQQAMPRGQGWGAAAFSGAQSLKVFELNDGRIGISEVTVTDQCDEFGRGGIRHAGIKVMPAAGIMDFLEARLRAYPPGLRAAARQKLPPTVFRRLLHKAIPRLKGRGQLVLAHQYTNQDEWRLVEVLVLRLIRSAAVRLLEGWSIPVSFTTLALDWRDESRVVVLPLERARQISAPLIVIS